LFVYEYIIMCRIWLSIAGSEDGFEPHPVVAEAETMGVVPPEVPGETTPYFWIGSGGRGRTVYRQASMLKADSGLLSRPPVQSAISSPPPVTIMQLSYGSATAGTI
jgi:hypothetical protein